MIMAINELIQLVLPKPGRVNPVVKTLEAQLSSVKDDNDESDP